MKYFKSHIGASLIVLFCSVITLILFIATKIFECEMNHSTVNTEETLGAFASYYGAIIGGILSGVIAIGGVFLSLYFYQKRYQEEDVAKVQPNLKLEATNPGFSVGLLLSSIDFIGLENPLEQGYPVEFQATNIGNGYLKIHSIKYNGISASDETLTTVLDVKDKSKFVVCVKKQNRLSPFQLQIEFYDSMSNLYVQDYNVNWDDARGYYVNNGYPKMKWKNYKD